MVKGELDVIDFRGLDDARRQHGDEAPSPVSGTPPHSQRRQDLHDAAVPSESKAAQEPERPASEDTESCPLHIQQRRNLVVAFRNMASAWPCLVAATLSITLSNVANLHVWLWRAEDIVRRATADGRAASFRSSVWSVARSSSTRPS